MKNLWIGLGLMICLFLAACNGTSDTSNQVVADTNEVDEASTSEAEQTENSLEAEDESSLEIEETTNEEEQVTFSVKELEAVFYIGMNYTTYLDEVTGVFEIEQTYVDEHSNDMLDVFEAYDGYLGIVYSPDEGIKQLLHYQEANEASSYFN
ncbi:hypothetical protein [Alkalicoccobacillus gibsonii]|uniref:hypothetical protein n=1 Tax=Alkalicoccobacillus gibsonii TaxID=79881 RepID=UPI0019342B09|nr:hypothetical protein [Alkalicoccobacillus gibsonii]MBM0066284.1 hypothetical protein [Alkalicoccobacillus gibsonii]